jgi:hypothetical protein
MNNNISFLNSEIMRNQVYHNHKENMAWVATALYVSGSFILGLQLQGIVCGWQKAIAIVIASVITGLAVYFVCWQFKNRRIAASRVKRLIEIAEDYLNNDKKDDELARYIKCIKEHKDDPDKTTVISLAVMGIAFVVFLILICC